MAKVIIPTFFSILLLISCWENKNNMDKRILSTSDQVKLLVDLYLIDATIDLSQVVHRDSIKATYLEYLNTTKGYSSELITYNLEYLKNNPDTLVHIQNIALDTLREIQNNLQSSGRKFYYNLADEQ